MKDICNQQFNPFLFKAKFRTNAGKPAEEKQPAITKIKD
jgi:hypothetical protein